MQPSLSKRLLLFVDDEPSYRARSSRDRWRQLREQAAVERNPQEIAKLMREILRLLVEKLLENNQSLRERNEIVTTIQVAVSALDHYEAALKRIA
jgi:hypothetical protein